MPTYADEEKTLHHNLASYFLLLLVLPSISYWFQMHRGVLKKKLLVYIPARANFEFANTFLS